MPDMVSSVFIQTHVKGKIVAPQKVIWVIHDSATVTQGSLVETAIIPSHF